MIDDLPPLRDVIREHGLAARKSLGQNFILDLNLTRKIAAAAGPLEGVNVLEIGPGPGGLTRALLQQGARQVVSVEKDARCIEALGPLVAASGGRLTLVGGDALEINEANLLEPFAPPHRVVANLPYNIGTALFVRWLESDTWPPFYDRLVLLFQKEVAERMVAAPGSKAYGRLSVLAQWRGTVRILFGLPASAFVPQPKVASALISYQPGTPYVSGLTQAKLSAITLRLFSTRRKMLRKILRSVVSDPGELLSSMGIPETARAEELDVQTICRLALRLPG